MLPFVARKNDLKQPWSFISTVIHMKRLYTSSPFELTSDRNEIDNPGKISECFNNQKG